MNKTILSLILLLTLTGCSKPNNFAECIIQDMKDVQNPQVFVTIHKACYAKFTSMYSDIEQGYGRGMFSYENRGECIIDNAKNTTFDRAASSMSVACGCLYDEPQYQGQSCKQYFKR